MQSEYLWQKVCSEESYQSQHTPLRTTLDHLIIMCTQPNVHIPSFGTFSCDIAPVMLDVKVVWLTSEYGTEMVTPLPVVNKHRKLSPASKGGRPELIVRVI